MITEFRPAGQMQSFFETYCGLASEGRCDNKGQPAFLQIVASAAIWDMYLAGPRSWASVRFSRSCGRSHGLVVTAPSTHASTAPWSLPDNHRRLPINKVPNLRRATVHFEAHGVVTVLGLWCDAVERPVQGLEFESTRPPDAESMPVSVAVVCASPSIASRSPGRSRWCPRSDRWPRMRPLSPTRR
jgi:hypothetical protein